MDGDPALRPQWIAGNDGEEEFDVESKGSSDTLLGHAVPNTAQLEDGNIAGVPMTRGEPR